jgi:CheY-like chemotaxis protein
MSGWELAKRLREKEPALPVVYVTASAAEEWASHGVPESVLIAKPFAPAQLLTALSNLLNIGPTQ